MWIIGTGLSDAEERVRSPYPEQQPTDLSIRHCYSM
jgi:hypothetical protein